MATGVTYEKPTEADMGEPVEQTKEKGGDDQAFLTAIRSAESTAYGGEDDGGLSSERAASIDDYLGRPYGNEQEGRSQVISRDVYDTIEWMKPSFARIFCSGDEVARFEPQGPEDVQAAEQETDYINYVIQEKNSWFTIFNEWSTDALLTKNAYCMAYWDKTTRIEREQYQGITEDQLAMLLQDEGVELVQHSAKPAPMAQPQMGPAGQPAPAPMLHDVVIKRSKDYQGVKLCVLPPERCLVSEATPGMSVKDSDFFEYWEMKTISEVRSMGFDIPDDVRDSSGDADTEEDSARDQFDEGSPSRNDAKPNDPSLRKVRVRTVWIKFDYDGDGIAEHRRAIVVGDRVLSNEDSSGVQVASIVPTPFPHRHPGLSVRDMVTDLQEIKTSILRATLDNLYLANNGRYGISDKVNVDDMLVSRPGGLVRVQGGIPSQEIFPFVHPQVAAQGLTVMEYVDRIRESRTGTSQAFTGVDANALDKSHSGVAIAQLTSAAAQRVEMIARVFAEGVKELFLIVHELCLKHGHQAQVVRLKNNWVNVDPSSWKKRYDMRISVGLGTGNKEQLMNNLMLILKAQKEAIQIGATTPDNIYNALVELTKAAGFSSPEKFWTKPSENQPQQPAPNPEEVKAKAELEKEQIKQQGETQRTGMEIQSEEKIAVYKTDRDFAAKTAYQQPILTQ